MKQRKILVEIISVFLIILWLYASISKLLDYPEFRFQLGRSPYIQHFAGLVAVALPAAEIAMAIALIFGRVQMLGLYASFFTMFLFTGYIYAMLNYSDYIPCSCGGILNKMSWEAHFWFNVFVTLLSLIAILLKPKSSMTTKDTAIRQVQFTNY